MSEQKTSSELEQCKNQIDGMNMQISAAREMINENQNVILTLKTNLMLYAKAHNELAKANDKLVKENALIKDENLMVKGQNAVLSTKILELTPVVQNEQPTVE